MSDKKRRSDAGASQVSRALGARIDLMKAAAMIQKVVEQLDKGGSLPEGVSVDALQDLQWRLMRIARGEENDPNVFIPGAGVPRRSSAVILEDMMIAPEHARAKRVRGEETAADHDVAGIMGLGSTSRIREAKKLYNPAAVARDPKSLAALESAAAAILTKGREPSK